MCRAPRTWSYRPCSGVRDGGDASGTRNTPLWGIFLVFKTKGKYQTLKTCHIGHVFGVWCVEETTKEAMIFTAGKREERWVLEGGGKVWMAHFRCVRWLCV